MSTMSDAREPAMTTSADYPNLRAYLAEHDARKPAALPPPATPIQTCPDRDDHLHVAKLYRKDDGALLHQHVSAYRYERDIQVWPGDRLEIWCFGGATPFLLRSVDGDERVARLRPSPPSPPSGRPDTAVS